MRILGLCLAAAGFLFAGGDDSFLLTGVTVHPVSSPEVANASLLVIDGKIAGSRRIKQLLAARRDGFRDAQADASLGKAVFKKTCAACHRLNGAGGKVGPDLDGVGLRGAERLLEAEEVTFEELGFRIVKSEV